MKYLRWAKWLAWTAAAFSRVLFGLTVWLRFFGGAGCCCLARRLRRAWTRPALRRRDQPGRADRAREQEILRLRAEDLTDRRFAAQLFLWERTVDHRVFAILGKLGVHSRAQAARRAARIPPEVSVPD